MSRILRILAQGELAGRNWQHSQNDSAETDRRNAEAASAEVDKQATVSHVPNCSLHRRQSGGAPSPARNGIAKEPDDWLGSVGLAPKANKSLARDRARPHRRDEACARKCGQKLACVVMPQKLISELTSRQRSDGSGFGSWPRRWRKKRRPSARQRSSPTSPEDESRRVNGVAVCTPNARRSQKLATNSMHTLSTIPTQSKRRRKRKFGP